MAIEILLDNYAKLLGYFTETRVPVLLKETKSGDKKEDKQLSDLDVIGHSLSNNLIIIESKAYGSVEKYSNWCNRNRILDIYNFIYEKKLIKQIMIDKWQRIFKKNGIGEMWIILPGYFEQKQLIKRFDKASYRGDYFINSCIHEFNRMYKDGEWDYIESDYIKLFERKLRKEFGFKCKIIPVHKLIEDLMLIVCDDIFKRRKRYSDTALETFRWLVKANGHDRLDLGKIGEKLKKRYNEKKRGKI